MPGSDIQDWEYAWLQDGPLSVPANSTFCKAGQVTAAGMETNRKVLFISGGIVSHLGGVSFKFVLRKAAAPGADQQPDNELHQFMAEHQCKVYDPINPSLDSIVCRRVPNSFKIFAVQAVQHSQADMIRLELSGALTGSPAGHVDIGKEWTMTVVMRAIKDHAVATNLVLPQIRVGIDVLFSGRSSAGKVFNMVPVPAKRRRVKP